jgi:glucose dehydrogenase
VLLNPRKPESQARASHRHRQECLRRIYLPAAFATFVVVAAATGVIALRMCFAMRLM